jgi:hypothetical protein
VIWGNFATNAIADIPFSSADHVVERGRRHAVTAAIEGWFS